MKIFLPFQVKDIGGTSTFARKFQSGMEAQGHQVIFKPEPDYDVLFLIVQCPLRYLLDAKRRGKKIIQRLDGTYYYSVAGWKFPLLNAKAAYIRHIFTDFTIYQSEYSRYCANRFLGKKLDDQHAVINNGVDPELFSPVGPKALKRDGPTQKIFFTASAFRRQDQIKPIIDALLEYQKKPGRDFKLYIAGNFTGAVRDWPTYLKTLPFVELLGKVTNADLPPYERSADLFLFTHLNPPCPNNILEALGCGLPIIGVNDGAMSELVDRSYGELIAASGDAFWRPRSYNAKQFAQKIERVWPKRAEYAQAARARFEKDFTLDLMIKNYVQAFKQTMS